MTDNIQCALIIGATSGTGLELAKKLSESAVKVIALGRTPKKLTQVSKQYSSIEFVQADAADAQCASSLLQQYNPDLIVLSGGSVPVMAAITDLDWQQFSDPWHNDVKMAFEWTKALLRDNIEKPRLFISISSGASINGSPLSGGYAGAKRMQTFINSYAQREANLAEKALRFVTAIPKQMIQGTAIAETGSAAYAEASNKTAAQFMSQWHKPLSTALAAQQLMEIIAEDPIGGDSYALTGSAKENIS